jgi:flavin-dependent dehydrogenase
MNPESTGIVDVVIAGGGPAGSTAATMLRKLGHSVVVLEKTPHPRFHIGESLLPFSMALLRRIDFMSTMQEAGFVPKWGSRFMLGDRQLAHTFYFPEGSNPGGPPTYQVTRSRFDHLLLDHCRRFGADVREGHTVTNVELNGGETFVTVQPPEGSSSTLRTRFFADATGRDTFMANRLKLKRMDRLLRKVAVFAHFTGAVRDEGRDAGNTISVVIRSGWIWFIPLENGITSVGVVADANDFKASGKSPEDFLHDTLDRVPELHARLTTAQRVTQVHVTSDFSYSSKRLYGDRFIVLGDAGFFLDPVFSSGVHLAISAGVYGAEAVHAELNGRSGNPLRHYEKRLRRSQKLYFKFIYGWYQPGFLELFLRPTRKFQLVEAITSVLGGATTNRGVRFRVWLFFLLVRLNRFVSLAPAINRAGLPP